MFSYPSVPGWILLCQLLLLLGRKFGSRVELCDLLPDHSDTDFCQFVKAIGTISASLSSEDCCNRTRIAGEIGREIDVDFRGSSNR